MKENISYPAEASTTFYEIEDRSFWFRQRNKIIQFFVSSYLKPGNFVDIGGGNGYVSSNLASTQSGLDIILIEPSKAGCENALKRGLKKVFNKTLQEFSEYPVIDNMGIFDVIEHIQEDETFLKELYSRLTPGGKVFLTTPAYHFLWSNEDVNAGHFRRYTIKELHLKARDAGFEIEQSAYFFISLIPLIFLLRRLPFILGLAKESDFSADHKETLLTKSLEKVLSFEIWLLKQGIKLPFGASIVMCLKK